MKQKAPFSELINEKRSFLGFNLVRLAVVLVSIGLLFAGTLVIKQKNQARFSRQKEMKRLVVKIKNLEKEISDRQGDLMKLLLTFKEKSGMDISYLHLMDLTDREKNLLKQRVRTEKGVTVKSLLQTILAKAGEINELQKRVGLIEDKLPQAVLVQKGQNHHDIALAFLQGKCGLTNKDAIAVVNQTSLYEQVVPGFRVWNFYQDGIFGTFVTKGEASVSPGWLQKRAREKSVALRETLTAERNKLSGNVANLQENNRGLNSKLSELNSHFDALSGRFSQLSSQYQSLDKRWNSLFFTLDLRKHLVEKGIIKRGFLRSPALNEFSPLNFPKAIDLRKSQQIRVTAADLKAKKIKRVVVYPKHFKKGVDYRVTIPPGGDMAVVTILKAEKLKNEHVVISVD